MYCWKHPFNQWGHGDPLLGDPKITPLAGLSPEGRCCHEMRVKASSWQLTNQAKRRGVKFASCWYITGLTNLEGT